MRILNVEQRQVRIPVKGIPGVQMQPGFVQELIHKREQSVIDRVSGFLSLIRPLFLLLTPVNAASAVVLALGGFPILAKCVSGFFTVALASCAVNVFNDYLDRKRDQIIWPDRAIPSGRVKSNEALLLSVFSAALSLSIAWLVFNPLTFYILLIAIIMGGFYSLYLRDKVGYLSLPPIVGLIFLGGWAAVSPETLFSSALPWYLYSLGVVWQAAHIMIYYPLHMLPDSNHESSEKVPPVFFFIVSAQFAVKIGMVLICLTLLLSLLLPLVAPLGFLYLGLVVAAGLFTLISGIRYIMEPFNRKQGITSFKTLTLFRLIISLAIVLTIFLAST